MNSFNDRRCVCSPGAAARGVHYPECPMKNGTGTMKIALGTIEIDDDTRRLIEAHYGGDGLASRDRCRRFIVSNGTGALDDLRYSAQVADEDREDR